MSALGQKRTLKSSALTKRKNPGLSRGRSCRIADLETIVHACPHQIERSVTKIHIEEAWCCRWRGNSHRIDRKVIAAQVQIEILNFQRDIAAKGVLGARTCGPTNRSPRMRARKTRRPSKTHSAGPRAGGATPAKRQNGDAGYKAWARNSKIRAFVDLAVGKAAGRIQQEFVDRQISQPGTQRAEPFHFLAGIEIEEVGDAAAVHGRGAVTFDVG